MTKHLLVLICSGITLAAAPACSPRLGFEYSEVDRRALPGQIGLGILPVALRGAYLTTDGAPCVLRRLDFPRFTIQGFQALVESLDKPLELAPNRHTSVGSDGTLAAAIPLPLQPVPQGLARVMELVAGHPRVQSVLRYREAPSGVWRFTRLADAESTAGPRDTSIGDLFGATVQFGSVDVGVPSMHGIVWDRTAPSLLWINRDGAERLAVLDATRFVSDAAPARQGEILRAGRIQATAPGAQLLPALTVLRTDTDVPQWPQMVDLKGWREAAPPASRAVTAAVFRAFADHENGRVWLDARLIQVRRAPDSDDLELFPAVEAESLGSPIVTEGGVVGVVGTIRLGRPLRAGRPAAPPSSPAAGSELARNVLRIETRPQGATVWIDGFRQEIPGDADYEVLAGRHQVQVRLAGYDDQSFPVDLSQGHRKYTVDMTRSAASTEPAAPPVKRRFTIVTDPPGAQVYIDGQVVPGVLTPAELSLAPGMTVKVFHEKSLHVTNCSVPQTGRGLRIGIADDSCRTLDVGAPPVSRPAGRSR